MEQKYGLMELKDGDKVIAYVAAKCIVVKHTEYNLNGKKGSIYHIVFSWNPNGENNIEPIYDKDGNCTNSVMVDQIFDNALDCKKVVENLNEDIAKNEIKNAKIYEVRDLAKKLRANFQMALDLQEKYLNNNSTQIIIEK